MRPQTCLPGMVFREWQAERTYACRIVDVRHLFGEYSMNANVRWGSGRRNGHAVQVLHEAGFPEAAEAVRTGQASPEDRAALLAALEDDNVPRDICHVHIRPLLQQLDEPEAAGLFVEYMSHVGDAAEKVAANEGQLNEVGAYQVKAALLRAARIRFGGILMGALERMLMEDRLPPPAVEWLKEFPQLADAVAAAKAAEERTRASALLKCLVEPYWVKVREILPNA